MHTVHYFSVPCIWHDDVRGVCSSEGGKGSSELVSAFEVKLGDLACSSRQAREGA